MGVPGHDQRDFEFATKYELPITRVVAKDAGEAGAPMGNEAEPGDGVIVNSNFLDGMSVEDAKADVITKAESGGWGEGHNRVAPARLGHFAPALLGYADPLHPLFPRKHWLRDRASAQGPASGHPA